MFDWVLDTPLCSKRLIYMHLIFNMSIDQLDKSYTENELLH